MNIVYKKLFPGFRKNCLVVLFLASCVSEVFAADSVDWSNPKALSLELSTGLTFASRDTVPQKANGEEDIFQIQHLERLPEFKGGVQGWMRYLQNTLRYPTVARDRRVTGRVILKFVVEKDGTLTDIQVLKSPDDLLSEEAVRVVARSPKWLPGIQENRPVRVAYTMPITFNLGAGPERSTFPSNQ